METSCSRCGDELVVGARFCASCGNPVPMACSTCLAELPSGAAFCPSCGSEQTTTPTPHTGHEELRVLSCLFADLADFTSRTEQSDPEDVRARLAIYHLKVREDVERWGGHVEKLMGDGVFAVFGLPTIHEDDPERAVRAALRIQQSIESINASDPALDLSVRIGITTGEAIVGLGASDQNERIIGDVVNTASRLVGVADPDSVVIDERTHLATRNVIDYAPLDPVYLRGKAAPLTIWQARQARSRYGVAVDENASAEFIGRQDELNLLADALNRATSRRKPQLMTISGEPGVGKSRLLREFRSTLDDRPDVLVRWRQGRSLPHGEGITFWALSEIVKSEAGILESETQDEARAKLDASIHSLANGQDDVDEAWLRQRLAPLAGVGRYDRVERAELFSAWLQYVELLAAKDPLVLALEDLHWADDALADFVEHLLDWSQDAPVLIVCTARPDWFSRRPDWGGGNREAATIGLLPLSPTETAQLVGSISGQAVMPAGSQRALLDRSGGNPLYLTEYLKLAMEKGWFERATSLDDLPMPDSIQAIIAARLDLLDRAGRASLQAAAVIGRVFWTGAVSFLRGQDDIAEALRGLVRRELVRPVRRSSMQGQEEFIFTHILARDVAYGQLTKSEKARLHRETARWLEAVSGGRAIDVAELLAHHHTTALELEPSDDPELLNRVHGFLMLAWERTEGLDVEAAARFARRAAEIATDPVNRGMALMAIGRVNRSRETSEPVLTEAIDLFRTAGDRLHEAEALADRYNLLWWTGDTTTARADLDLAMELIDGIPDDSIVAKVLATYASHMQLAGHVEESLDAVERAIATAGAVGDISNHAKALRIRGQSLVALGNPAGADDVLEALAIALDRGNTQEAMNGYNGQATYLAAIGRAMDAVHLIDEAIAYGEQRGYEAAVEWSKQTKCEALIQLGRIDDIDALANELVEADAARGGSQVGLMVPMWQSFVRWARGDVESAWRTGLKVVDESREVGDIQVRMPAVSSAILFGNTAGHDDSLPDLIGEIIGLGVENPTHLVKALLQIAPAMIRLNLVDELEALTRLAETSGSTWLAASVDATLGLIDEARGNHRSALNRILPAIDVGDELSLDFHTVQLRIAASRCAYALDDTNLAEELLVAARSQAHAMGIAVVLDQIDTMENTRAAG